VARLEARKRGNVIARALEDAKRENERRLRDSGALIVKAKHLRECRLAGLRRLALFLGVECPESWARSILERDVSVRIARARGGIMGR
jgi:hypothetical protein